MKFSRNVALVAMGVTAVVLLCARPTFAETTGTDVLLEEIPVGPADEDIKTSMAVSRILTSSAEAYLNTSAMHAEGSYIYVSKAEDDETSYITAAITMDYLRPDKMAIVCKSEDESLDCAFYANGTTSTHVSAADKAYVKLPQPESLSAYAETYRAGELYDEYSGALAFSVTGPILVAEDPMKWMFEDITRFIYEGKEEVNGVSCYRVRFIQEDPDVIVIVWVNEKTWLIDKASFIRSYDEDYNLVESFEEGDTATMSIMTWDSQSTDSKSVNQSAFDARVPKSFEHTQDVPEVESGEESKGLWESLVGLAAETSPEETTWSLTRQSGSMEMKLKRFAEAKVPVVDLEATRVTPGQPAQMIVGSEDGTVSFYSADGALTSTTQLNQELGLFNLAVSETSETLLVTADKFFNAVKTYDLQGRELWTYRHPFTTVESITTAESPDTGVYVSLSGENGVRKLSTTGTLLWATTKTDYIQSVHETAPGVDRVIARSLDEVYILNRELKLLRRFSPDEWIGPVKWDADDNAFPLVCLAYSTDKDVMLQRRSESGEIARTIMIQPKATDITGSGFSWARLPVDGVIEKCAVVLMSNGTAVVVSNRGKTLYRGLLQANAALVKKNDDSVVVSLVVADLDGNGVDEIYTRMHNNLMQITAAE